MFDQVNPYPGGPGPTRPGPSSTRRPWHVPTRTGGISSVALYPERCRDRGVSAVPGDTWPTCSLSRGQLCLHDQVDLDTLTAELLVVVHQTVEPTASCSGCGRRSPARTGSLGPTARTGMVALRSGCFLTPSAAGCRTRLRLTDHRDRRQGDGAGGAAMPGRSAGRRPPHYPRSCAQAGERRRRSGLTACSGHGGHPITAPLAVRNDLRNIVRMGSPVRFRRGAPHPG
jgi:hypothetical protein